MENEDKSAAGWSRRQPLKATASSMVRLAGAAPRARNAAAPGAPARSIAVIALAILLLSPLGLEPAAPAAAPQPSGAEALERILDDYWNHQLEQSLDLRLRHGLAVERLPDVSFEQQRREADFAQALLDRLEAIRAAELEPEQRLSAQILGWELRQTVEALQHFWPLFQITPYSLPLRPVHQALATHRFQAPADLQRYLNLLRQYAALIRGLQTNLEIQQAKGILLPQDAIDPVLRILRSLIQPPEQSLFRVARERLDGLEPERVDPFFQAIATIVTDQIHPSLERLAAALGPTYRAKAPQQVGLGQYPGGPEAYRFLVGYHTTLDGTPEAIHQRGLEAVEKLSRQMAQIRSRLGFEGSQESFHRQLRRDPRFLAGSAEQVGERLMAAVRRIEPKVGDFFLQTPGAPYGVKRLDPALEGSLTYGYYEWPTATEPRGHYLYNGSKLDQRPLVNAAALIYHELVPGHHFQVALQGENLALPAARRESFHTAFVEGWAEYASSLGVEMGLYEDPYDLYGRLLMDMFLSVRLVVDTGMNHLGWSRERAMEFMHQNVLESDTQIETESLRYSTDMPGQALAYKVGSAKIWELRQRAERALGARFDLRRFHHQVLGSGSMPLSILERHIERWTEAGGC